ncbi:MAG: PorT family protein [Bacteroidia bacterium]|nr:PorT family protein [Bacteroidia bacterium]MBT8278896.1 PorT family protein [Bacteroidia bacterium]NND24849.1 PorT family protein [Flavobacteriaceae bacterium]NNK59471.1 PorT family protein [Flavobacteriaceae bacterium]NNL32448.1 PorT family protein [Flavobacteriaceae bacterium]
MKKPIFLILIVTLIFMSCAGTRMGVVVGPNFSNVVGDQADSWKTKTSIHGGVVADLPVDDKISIQPGLIYSSQGADYSESAFSGTVNLDYLNIPIMGKFEVAEGFNVQVGPQVGFLLSAKDKEDGEPDVDVKDFVKSTDFGVNIGVGYELANGLNFGARYNLGLSDLNDDPDLSDEGVKWKNSVIQISIGYLFDLTKKE